MRLAALGLAALVLYAYWPVGGFSFLGYDDPIRVTENPWVRQGLGAASATWAFTTLTDGHWHPLTWLSHMLDVTLFGLDAGWHHRTNVLLHVASSLLLFAALTRMTRAPGRSLLVAALFALHPLHVESVAWVSERKDMLSGLFWMLGLYAYALYAERPSRMRFAAVALAFACGLASKAMVVTFPLVLLLLDVWPLARLRSESARRLALEKLPLLAGSALFALVTFLAQQRAGAVATTGVLPLDARVAQALISSVAYLGKSVWPRSLACFYPYPDAISLVKAAGAASLLLALTALALRYVRTRPYLAVGWFWYLVTLLPVVGLVQVGMQAMADRYTYLPLVGIFIAAVFGAYDLLAARTLGRRLLAPLAAAVVAACVLLTRIQVGYWQNDIVLNEHALAVTQGNFVAHNNLALAFVSQQRYAEAQAHLEEALRIRPGYPDARNNLAGVLIQQGRLHEAADELRTAVVNSPTYAPAHRNLAALLQQMGRPDEAAAHLREAERLEAGAAPPPYR
ncbi:MAG TPA: tetratricopeptide repeat protein [Myxococcota bacterium]|nr:tetratricopeptide repeat protein [Myxococcota bacterium]